MKIAAALFLSLCAQAQPAPPPEPIIGVERHPDRLAFIVRSNGCTRSEHFALHTSTAANRPTHLTLVRTRPDRCRKMPHDVSVDLPTTVPAAEAIVIDNPLIAPYSRVDEPEQR